MSSIFFWKPIFSNSLIPPPVPRLPQPHHHLGRAPLPHDIPIQCLLLLNHGLPTDAPPLSDGVPSATCGTRPGLACLLLSLDSSATAPRRATSKPPSSGCRASPSPPLHLRPPPASSHHHGLCLPPLSGNLPRPPAAPQLHTCACCLPAFPLALHRCNSLTGTHLLPARAPSPTAVSARSHAAPLPLESRATQLPATTPPPLFQLTTATTLFPPLLLTPHALPLRNSSVELRAWPPSSHLGLG